MKILTLSRVGTLLCPPITRISFCYILHYLNQSFPLVSLPGGAFFSLGMQRKEPKEKAAAPLRQPRPPRSKTGGAKTRYAQTVSPFIRFRITPPGSAPMASFVPGSSFTPINYCCLGGMHFYDSLQHHILLVALKHRLARSHAENRLIYHSAALSRPERTEYSGA